VTSTGSFLRRRSLRVRITLAFVATGVLLAGALATATFLAVQQFLEAERVRTATDDTIVALQLGREFFLQEDVEPDLLVAQLQLRGTFESIVTQPDDFFRSTLSLTTQAIPLELRDLVTGEDAAYQFTTLDGARAVVFGAPLPPEQTDLFLFFPLGDLDQTLSVLLRVLIVTGLAIVSIAAIIAQRVAGRILRPVGEISAAAQRVAEGLLETRVQTATPDEVGVLAASFNQMAEAFQEMIQRERRFVANVSHELRTPMATLRTASELLAGHRDEFPASAREAVDLIAEDVANVRRLIEELMEVSEVDAGRAIIRWEELDLGSLARAVVTKMRRNVPVTGHNVVTVSDKARVERILANLIDNAYEHGQGLGVQVEVAHDTTECSISVSDDGPGISSEDLPRLFDRFFKADQARTRERGGIGLGLAIAFENARLIGGRLDATSKHGRGSTFTLHVPARSEMPEDDR